MLNPFVSQWFPIDVDCIKLYLYELSLFMKLACSAVEMVALLNDAERYFLDETYCSEKIPYAS